MCLFWILNCKFNEFKEYVHSQSTPYFVQHMTSFLFPGLWGSQSELILTVNNIIRNKTAVSDQLHLLLKKHKPDFNALFTNPVSIITSRLKAVNSLHFSAKI